MSSINIHHCFFLTFVDKTVGVGDNRGRLHENTRESFLAVHDSLKSDYLNNTSHPDIPPELCWNGKRCRSRNLGTKGCILARCRNRAYGVPQLTIMLKYLF